MPCKDDIIIRPADEKDSPSLLQVHYDVIHKIAVKDYPPHIIKEWAPKIDKKRLDRFSSNTDNELRYAVEKNNRIIGLGALVLAKNELRACYIAPDYNGQGVGTSLVNFLEKISIENGLQFLEFPSSLTAEKFYNKLGYTSQREEDHVMRSGIRMKSIIMYKKLI